MHSRRTASLKQFPFTCKLDSAPIVLGESSPSPFNMARALRTGECPPNRAFDRYLPREFQAVSYLYWTPLVAALRAAEWLDELDIRKVMDIGSGVGKFCVVAALAGNAHYVGIEQRARLVAAARGLARTFGVADRVEFIHGNFDEKFVPDADAFYFYNSFGENLFDPDECLDADVELSDARYLADIAAAERMLRDARVGTYLLTYNGFGGEVPDGYSEVRVDRELPCMLCLWQKTT